jgi:hypothetical protein
MRSLVVDAPVLVGPAVEGPEGGVGRVDVVHQRLLHAHGEGREHEAAGHALGVHHLEAGVSVAVGGADGLERAERAPDVVGRRPAAEVVVEAARAGHRVELRVRDEPVDLARHHEPGAAVDLAHCMVRLAMPGSRCRVKASVGS